MPTRISTDARQNDAQTYWDRVNHRRWGRHLRQVEESVLLKAQALAGAPSNAVDLGCGSGQWSQLLSKFGWQMTCLDADEKALGVCRHNVPSATHILVEPGSSAIPCESNSASMLICIEVAPVMEADWFAPETSRVLAEGGILVGVCLNRCSWRGAMHVTQQRLRSKGQNATHYRHSYSSLRKRLVAAGFELVHEDGFCWAPFSRTSDSVLVPLATKLEKALGLSRCVSVSPWVIFIARKMRQPGKPAQPEPK